LSGTPIRLVIADIDGTIVNSAKELTDATLNVVQRLRSAGVRLAITSSRPPRGLTMFFEPLDLTTPISAFNGGLIVDRNLATLRELMIYDEVVEPVIGLLEGHGLSIWVYQGVDWFVLDVNGPHVTREAEVCRFEPTQLANFHGVFANVIKVVGVSDAPAVIARATADLDRHFGDEVSATSSQPYYLDVTHCDANKGGVVDFLADRFSLERRQIAAIGDGGNDVSMFDRAGLSVAMGNATDAVKSRAGHVTSSNNDDGFAKAIEELVLDGAS